MRLGIGRWLRILRWILGLAQRNNCKTLVFLPSFDILEASVRRP
jgi:hypothetical protein